MLAAELADYVGGVFFFQAEDGIRDLVRSRGLGDVYKRQVYSIFRMYLSYQAPIKYDWDYYLNANNISGNIHSNFPNLLKGTFFAFRLAWIIPVWALIQSAIRKQYKITIALVLMLLVPFFQLFIAYDISRLLCLCFPAVLVGFDYLFKEKPRQTVIVCIIIILVNLILPVCIVGKDGLMRIV